MKESKNRRGLAQKLYKFFLHKNKQEISIYYDNKEIHAKNIFLAVLYLLGIVLKYQNAKSIGKEQLNVFMTERYI